jgi:hypothetical protein
MTAEDRLFADSTAVLQMWDDMSDAERDGMPEEVRDAFIALRRTLVRVGLLPPNDGSET